MEKASKGVHDSVYDLLVNEKPGRAFDIGAGTGAFSKRLADLGFDTYACGSDVVKEKTVNFKKFDLNSYPWPYKDGFFDYVVSIEVIEHLENPYLFLREISRIVKKGGTVILTTPNTQNWYSRLYFLLTGRLLGFGYIGPEASHITPINLNLFRGYVETLFKIRKVTFNRSFIPILRIPLPFKSLFFSDVLILELKK